MTNVKWVSQTHGGLINKLDHHQLADVSTDPYCLLVNIIRLYSEKVTMISWWCPCVVFVSGAEFVILCTFEVLSKTASIGICIRRLLHVFRHHEYFGSKSQLWCSSWAAKLSTAELQSQVPFLVTASCSVADCVAAGHSAVQQRLLSNSLACHCFNWVPIQCSGVAIIVFVLQKVVIRKTHE